MIERRLALVTGATGFVGQAVIAGLVAGGWAVRAVARELPTSVCGDENLEWRLLGDIGAATDWSDLVAGCDAVIHLAARVHLMSDASASPLDAYRRINTVATSRLAWAAARAGVRRLLFLSSLKVNGEDRERAYDEADLPAPHGPYAISKYEAEEELRHISAATGIEAVILRPPLVYGPGVKANFLRLLAMVDSGIPLPFAAIANRRSLIFLGNLADAMVRCLDAPAAAGKTYLISDGADMSTPELVRTMAHALGRPARLVPVPVTVLRAAGWLARRPGAVDRLVGTLAADSARIRRELNWSPPYSVADGMQETVRWFKRRRSGQ